MDKLRTEHLFKKYGKRTVVNDVSIYLEQGEIVGLLGPNGAGKTTTFYMTTGLVSPNDGKIFLNELEITTMPVYKRAKLGIGYLPQEASVFRKMTVEDNIRSVLEMTNFTKEYQAEKLEQLIKAYALMLVTDEGISISFNDVQFSNTLFPISVKLSGSLILIIFEHP